jgi:hypothetical protein
MAGWRIYPKGKHEKANIHNTTCTIITFCDALRRIFRWPEQAGTPKATRSVCHHVTGKCSCRGLSLRGARRRGNPDFCESVDVLDFACTVIPSVRDSYDTMNVVTGSWLSHYFVFI